MKPSRLYTVVLFLATFISIDAQIIMREQERRSNQIDTIFINDNTSFLVFDHDIFSFSIGNENDFAAIAHKNSFHVRARTRRGGTISSAFISYGDSTFVQYRYVILKYDPFKMREFYDFRSDFHRYRVSDVQRRAERELQEEDKDNFFISQLRTRARNIQNMPDELSLGSTSNNLSLICRLIRIDNEYAYMKFEFINNSAINYDLEKVSFQYERRFRQGFLKRKKTQLIDVFPVIQPEHTIISAYSNYQIVYVIPIYGLQDSEAMIITFRERMGGRNIELRIDATLIAQSRLLFQ